jgi:hypothetical protein
MAASRVCPYDNSKVPALVHVHHLWQLRNNFGDGLSWNADTLHDLLGQHVRSSYAPRVTDANFF